MPLKWGIASAGLISHDFVSAVHTLPSANHEVIAVAARKLEDATKFAKLHKIPKVYEGYLNLAVDKDIDVVYVGSINTQHYSITKMMLENGKHVLCEKPLMMNAKQTKEILELAAKKKVFLMDAVWSRCFPVYEELKKQIASGAIGDLLYVNVTFGEPLQDVERVVKKELGGGGILDIGIYTLQFVQYVFRGLKPIKFIATGHLNEYGTDNTVAGIFLYPDNKLGVVSCSTKGPLPNEAIVTGTTGIIKIPLFWCPDTIITPEGTQKFEVPQTELPTNFDNGGGMSYEAEEVRRCINAGLLESSFMTHAESLELSQLLDSYRSQVGVVFDEDK